VKTASGATGGDAGTPGLSADPDQRRKLRQAEGRLDLPRATISGRVSSSRRATPAVREGCSTPWSVSAARWSRSMPPPVRRAGPSASRHQPLPALAEVRLRQGVAYAEVGRSRRDLHFDPGFSSGRSMPKPGGPLENWGGPTVPLKDFPKSGSSTDPGSRARLGAVADLARRTLRP